MLVLRLFDHPKLISFVFDATQWVPPSFEQVLKYNMILSSSGAKQLFSVFLTVSWSVPTALLALLPGKAHSQQLDVVLDSNAINLVKSLVTTGSDLNPTSTRLIGDPSCSARFGNLRAVLDGDASMPDQGIILSSGSPESLVGGGMNTGGSVSTGFGRPGDSDLDALIDPVQTFDACFLEVEFESPPERDIVVSYVFASEEYLEWVGSGFVVSGRRTFQCHFFATKLLN